MQVMDNGKHVDQESARRLMETVSFELDTDLRLHPQRLELGKAELLTDAITLPFMDIEKRLAKYIIGSSPEEVGMLRRSMKDYLGRLNSNPLIPLHFRLKVLNRFERELELFDAEMTAAVLNAHKIGVDMVQKAARSQPGYYRIVVDMAANAVELAARLLRQGLEEYHVPAVIATRQVFDLSRLGLAVLPVLPEDSTTESDRLERAVSSHELLRKLDFFGKPKAIQKIIWQELCNHIGVLKPRFCHKGDAPAGIEGTSFLFTNFMRPHVAPEVTSRLPDKFISDGIAIPMDEFVDRLVTAINRVETVLNSPDLQKKDLHTEEALHATIAGGNAILESMHARKRLHERQDYAGVRAIFEPRLDKAMVESRTALVMNEYEYAPTERASAAAWSVIDISKGGACLERVSFEPLENGVGAIVGINWLPHKNEPMLAFIRWFKEPKPGEQRIGLHFIREKYRLMKGAMMGGAEDDSIKGRAWPLLVKPGRHDLTVIFPDAHIMRKMAFIISDESKSAHFKVQSVVETGPNYAIVKAVRAEELHTSQRLDFDFS
jgi:hypothetical protein